MLFIHSTAVAVLGGLLKKYRVLLLLLGFTFTSPELSLGGLILSYSAKPHLRTSSILGFYFKQGYSFTKGLSWTLTILSKLPSRTPPFSSNLVSLGRLLHITKFTRQWWVYRVALSCLGPHFLHSDPKKFHLSNASHFLIAIYFSAKLMGINCPSKDLALVFMVSSQPSVPADHNHQILIQNSTQMVPRESLVPSAVSKARTPSSALL